MCAADITGGGGASGERLLVLQAGDDAPRLQREADLSPATMRKSFSPPPLSRCSVLLVAVAKPICAYPRGRPLVRLRLDLLRILAVLRALGIVPEGLWPLVNLPDLGGALRLLQQAQRLGQDPALVIGLVGLSLRCDDASEQGTGILVVRRGREEGQRVRSWCPWGSCSTQPAARWCWRRCRGR